MEGDSLADKKKRSMTAVRRWKIVDDAFTTAKGEIGEDATVDDLLTVLKDRALNEIASK
jgi:hypothetical protein